MKKIIVQGMLIAAVFLSTWLLLRQIDWMALLKVTQKVENTEARLGEMIWEVFRKSDRENLDPFVQSAVDSLAGRICKENGIERQGLKLHILIREDVNAFALPGGHLVVYTGLIRESESQEELCGVLAHEIAHIELNHVMKKLIREVGFSAIISMTTGGGGADAVKGLAKMLSSTAFDRKMEKEADIRAVDYLVTAGIDPEPFAHFLYRLSQNEHEAIRHLSWISTHPGSEERSIYIVEYAKSRTGRKQQVIRPATWSEMQRILQEGSVR